MSKNSRREYLISIKKRYKTCLKSDKKTVLASVNVISDLKEGMRLSGIITNITKLGAFVNIGIKENGLLHISQISDSKFIKDPAEVLKLDQKLMVRTLVYILIGSVYSCL